MLSPIGFQLDVKKESTEDTTLNLGCNDAFENNEKTLPIIKLESFPEEFPLQSPIELETKELSIPIAIIKSEFDETGKTEMPEMLKAYYENTAATDVKFDVHQEIQHLLQSNSGQNSFSPTIFIPIEPDQKPTDTSCNPEESDVPLSDTKNHTFSYCGAQVSQAALQFHEFIHSREFEFLRNDLKQESGDKDEDLPPSLPMTMPAVVQNRKKIHACKICSEEFPYLSQKLKHEESHMFVSVYPCRFCSMTLSSEASQRMHENKHTGSRPYKCKYCRADFLYHSNKIVHERLHTGLKPHKCQYCEKSFTTSGAKIIHERVHTGEKPFPCAFCKKTFSTHGNRLTHENMHSRRESQN